MPCTSPYFDGALFNFMDIAQVGAPIAQVGAPDLFGARGKLPPLPPPLSAALTGCIKKGCIKQTSAQNLR